MRLASTLGIIFGAALSFQSVAANFSIPSYFELKLVDQNKAKSGFFSRTSELDTGEHQLLLRYKHSLENNNGDSQFVTSDYYIVYLDVSAKMTELSLNAKKPRNYFAAEKFAEAPKFDIVDQDGASIKFEQFALPDVDGLQLGRNYKREVAEFEAARKKSTATTPANSPLVNAPTQSTEYEMLQRWYEKADAKSRKAYKIWTIDPSSALEEPSTELEMLQFWHQKADEETRRAFQHWLVQ